MTSKSPLGQLPCRQSARQKNIPLNHSEDNEARPMERIDSAMLILRAPPTTEEWNNIVSATKNGIELTGTAAKKPPGPVIGVVDIGSSNRAYLFRMSLPGVSRDPGKGFHFYDY